MMVKKLENIWRERMNELAVVTEQTINEFLYGSETKLTEAQKRLFINLAIKNNLDPFKREIYAIPYGDRMSVVTGYEVYLKRAEASKQLDGWKCWIEGEGDNMKAVVEIKRKDWTTPFTHEVYRSEYDSKKSLWQSKPMTMLKKVAIAQAFRLAFPNELGGMIYTADEMIDAQPVEAVEIVEEKISEKQAKFVHVFFSKAGFDNDDTDRLMQHYFKVTSSKDITKNSWYVFMKEIEQLLGRTLTKNDPPINEEEFGVIGDYLVKILALEVK
jgi:phage recombination protein Bet